MIPSPFPLYFSIENMFAFTVLLLQVHGFDAGYSRGLATIGEDRRSLADGFQIICTEGGLTILGVVFVEGGACFAKTGTGVTVGCRNWVDLEGFESMIDYFSCLAFFMHTVIPFWARCLVNLFAVFLCLGFVLLLLKCFCNIICCSSLKKKKKKKRHSSLGQV